MGYHEMAAGHGFLPSRRPGVTCSPEKLEPRMTARELEIGRIPRGSWHVLRTSYADFSLNHGILLTENDEWSLKT